MNVPVNAEHDAAFVRSYSVLLVEYLPSLEVLTTTTATGVASSLIVFTEAGFDLTEERAAILSVLSGLMQIVQSANPLVTAQALGLVDDEQAEVFRGQGIQMRGDLERLKP